MENKFFKFFDCMWVYIDKGLFYRQPFRWLYIAFAVLNILIPIGIIYNVSSSGIFEYMSGGEVFVCILVFLLVILLGIMSFSLWMNREKKLKDILSEGNEFIAIPMVSHFIQTCGEWLGFYIGVGGSIASLLFVLFGMGNSYKELFGGGILPMGGGLQMIIMYPIIGYLFVVFGRLIAELYRALASIANNTKHLRQPDATQKDVSNEDESLSQATNE